jgi:transcriptional regulator with XRE-family HTH domain
MSLYLGSNIRFLRKRKELTQEELAVKLGLSRASLGSYEEGRAEPRLMVLQHFADYFSCSLDDLVSKDLSAEKENFSVRKKGEALRVLSVAVDSCSEKERIAVVPLKAAAGYLEGYGDPGFIESLPVFDLPLPELGRERSYRLFQIRGDSMLPVRDGSYIIASYIQDWNGVKDNECCVLVTKDHGLVYKRVLNRMGDNMLMLKSDNPAYETYSVTVENIAEIWKAAAYITIGMPSPEDNGLPAAMVMQMLAHLQEDMALIKDKIK